MHSVFFAPLAELFKLKPILELFLVLLGVGRDALARGTLKFGQSFL